MECLYQSKWKINPNWPTDLKGAYINEKPWIKSRGLKNKYDQIWKGYQHIKSGCGWECPWEKQLEERDRCQPKTQDIYLKNLQQYKAIVEIKSLPI